MTCQYFLQEDKSLIMKNIIKKEEDGMAAVITKASKVAFRAPVPAITEQQKAKGQTLINPSKPPLVSVVQALTLFTI